MDGGAAFRRHSRLPCAVFSSSPSWLSLLPCRPRPQAKTLRMAYDSDPTSLDPHEQLSGATLQMSHLLFDPADPIPPGPLDRAAARQELREDRRAHHPLPFARGREVSVGPHALGRGRGVDLQPAEAEPRLQGPVRALQRGARGRRPHRRSRDQGPLSAGAQPRHLHLPHGPRVLCRQRRARRPKDAIVKHGASFASTHASGTGPFIVTAREQGVRAQAQALRRLLGQRLARQCR